jgi:hypothetical protein
MMDLTAVRPDFSKVLQNQD